MMISICIPTFNRSGHLRNCLNSIICNRLTPEVDYEVCISDNCSTDNTEAVVQHAKEVLPIRYHKNAANLGIPRNFLNVVEMAKGEFIWLIGDDDLLMPTALVDLTRLLSEHRDCDFFYVNCFHLTTDYVLSSPQPFDTANLPANMVPFSGRTQSGEMEFFGLIHPNVSFDFLGGMFLSVFRRKNWAENVHVLKQEALLDSRTFSHFDNTFPHVKIFAHAFPRSKAYFNAIPLAVCLTGAREWSRMYAFVHSVRLVEALEEYRKGGLPFSRYLLCRNFALNNFIPDFVSMFLRRDESGFQYVKPLRLFFSNCLYPNFYLSFFNYFVRQIRLRWTSNLFRPSKSGVTH